MKLILIMFEKYKIILLIFIPLIVTLFYVSRLRFDSGKTLQLKVSENRVSYFNYCDRKRVNSSERCLCYADDLDVNSLPVNKSSLKCAMTFGESGRLGNLIAQYATLFALSKWNGRPALLTPGMGLELRKFFKVSLPVLSEELNTGINWNGIGIHDWMEESYKEFPGLFVRLGGYPSSYTFFRDFEENLRREFTLKDEIRERAQLVLRNISHLRTSTTFIGVHVRRGDYVDLMKDHYHGVLGDKKYFSSATDYFRARFPDAVFLVVSNDMEWCKENIDNDRNDVIFIGNKNESDPITDFALLVNCNHSIVSIGTYGYFAALFAGGETVYLTNFTMPDSPWNKFFRYDTAFPAHWYPIAADLSPVYALLTTESTPDLTSLGTGSILNYVNQIMQNWWG